MARVWLKRLGKLGQGLLLAAVVATTLLSVADWSTNQFSPKRVFDTANDPNVYFELGDEGWTDWHVDGASMIIFPRLPDGPNGIIPNPRGVSVAVHLVADAWITEKGGPGAEYELTPGVRYGDVQVYLPRSATNIHLAEQSEQIDDIKIANNSMHFGNGDLYDLARTNGKSSRAADGVFTLYPSLYYTYQTPQGRPTTFRAIVSYQLDFDVPDAFVGYNGVLSGVSRLEWDPGLGRTGLGLGGGGSKQPTFAVGACDCGLDAVAPAPSGNYNGDVVWNVDDASKPVTYEVSTKSWISEVVATSKTLWIPATLSFLVAVGLPTIASRRAKHRKDSP